MEKINLTQADENLLSQSGISQKAVNKQIQLLQKGTPPLSIVRPCSIQDGIRQLSQEEEGHCIELFDSTDQSKGLFIPASGVGSRMFKFLIDFLNTGKTPPLNNAPTEIQHLIRNLNSLPFLHDLNQSLHKNYAKEADMLIKGDQYSDVLREIIDEKGLNYLNLPKGLIPFHSYPGETSVITPFEEHILEGAHYLVPPSPPPTKSCFHFTLPPSLEENISSFLNKILNSNELSSSATIQTSIQDLSTETVSLNSKGELLRDSKGNLHLRPGGHGTLIQNLISMKEDIIFIKNIDNIAPQSKSETTIYYKKVLGGALIQLKSSLLSLYQKIENSTASDDTTLLGINALKKLLSIDLSSELSSFSPEVQKKRLLQQINRPLRVCGVVKNEGLPGGAPFWVKDTEKCIRPQIVEKAQVRGNEQQAIFQESTHFNPVDIVCSLNIPKLPPPDPINFIDNNAAFISEKFYLGEKIKIFEYPGLWNGAMSGWNTIFIEVPKNTFYPVKNLLDLLEPNHKVP